MSQKQPNPADFRVKGVTHASHYLAYPEPGDDARAARWNKAQRQQRAKMKTKKQRIKVVGGGFETNRRKH